MRPSRSGCRLPKPKQTRTNMTTDAAVKPSGLDQHDIGDETRRRRSPSPSNRSAFPSPRRGCQPPRAAATQSRKHGKHGQPCRCHVREDRRADLGIHGRHGDRPCLPEHCRGDGEQAEPDQEFGYGAGAAPSSWRSSLVMSSLHTDRRRLSPPAHALDQKDGKGGPRSCAQSAQSAGRPNAARRGRDP